MEKRELVCIVCPKGCRLTVEEDKNSECGYKVSGNTCKRGEIYGINEVTNPVRVITTTVKLKNCDHRRLPVKTNGAVPKELIFKCMEIINSAEFLAPIKVGEVLIENILSTGIDVVATKTIM